MWLKFKLEQCFINLLLKCLPDKPYSPTKKLLSYPVHSNCHTGQTSGCINQFLPLPAHELCANSVPATSNTPLLAGSKPQSIRNVVVLPAPLGPSQPKISPRDTSNEVLATAVKSPKVRTKSFTTNHRVSRAAVLHYLLCFSTCGVLGAFYQRKLLKRSKAKFSCANTVF